MKRLWIALALLVVLFSGGLAHSLWTQQFTQQLSGQLLQARQEADAGRWESAEMLTHSVETQWEARSLYLHIMFRHNSLDAIHSELAQAETYLAHKAAEEYAASLSRLVTQLDCLSHDEALTLANIL